MIKVKDGYAKLIGTTCAGSADRVLLSNGGDKSVSDFVLKRDSGASYQHLTHKYSGETNPIYWRVSMPDVAATWCMIQMSFSLIYSYSEGKSAKIVIYGNWWGSGGSSGWQNFVANVDGYNDTAIKVYGYIVDGHKYIYIYTNKSWETLSLDKVICSDHITSYDITGFTIDWVSELPSGYSSATMYYGIHSGNIGSYAAGSLTTTSKSIWGQTYWNSNGVPVDISISQVAKMPYVLFKNYDNDGEAGYVGRGASDRNDIQIKAYSGNKLELGANNSTGMTFTTSNNVGIGTSSPNAKLHVTGAIAVINDTVNSTYDALGYFRHYSNNDWGLIVDKSQSYSYGVDIRAAGGYALRVGNGNTRLIGATIIGADTTPSYTLDVRGTTRSTDRIYANEWIQFDNATGLYWPNTYGAHFYPNDTSSYGQFRLAGSKNGYSGIHFGSGTGYLTLMDNGSDKGAYQENWNWLWYFNARNGKLSLRTSSDFGADINLNGSVRTNSTYYGYGLYHLSYGSSDYFLTSDGGARYWPNLYDGRYLRYEGWWSYDSGQNVDDANGITFVYGNHGSPNGWGILCTFDYTYNSGYKFQLFAEGYSASGMYYRCRSSDRGGWTSWKTVIDDGNIGSQHVSYADSAGSVAWSNVTDKPSFATVATSGSYNDLTNKPTIPDVSDFVTLTTAQTITGAKTVNNTITFGTNNSYGIRTATNNYCKIGESGKAFYQAYVTNVYTNSLIPIGTGGSIGLTGKRYSYGYFSNAVYATSGFYESSDERLKNILNHVKVDLDKLSKLRKVYYIWKDASNTSIQLGMIAQDVQKLYPELVDVDEETGYLSLAYDKLSVLALEAIDVLYKEHKKLKERIDELEKLLYNNGIL